MLHRDGPDLQENKKVKKVKMVYTYRSVSVIFNDCISIKSYKYYTNQTLRKRSINIFRLKDSLNKFRDLLTDKEKSFITNKISKAIQNGERIEEIINLKKDDPEKRAKAKDRFMKKYLYYIEELISMGNEIKDNKFRISDSYIDFYIECKEGMLSKIRRNLKGLKISFRK